MRRRLVRLALALLVLLPGARLSADDSLEQSIELLDTLDRFVGSCDLPRVPLVRAIDELSAMLPVPIQVDWTSLERLGVDERTTVTLVVTRESGWRMLAGLAVQLGDEFGRAHVEAHAGHVILTTRPATRAMSATAIYDLRDLVAEGSALVRLRTIIDERMEKELKPADAPATTEPDPGGSVGDSEREADAEDDDEATGDGPPASFPALTDPSELDELLEDAIVVEPRTPGEELIELLTEHIDPEAWVDYGGDRATISERNGVVIVTAPATTHRALRGALAQLRRAVTTSVDLEAVIVDLPRDEVERLARRHDGRARRSFARAVTASSDAVVLWRGNAAAALEHPLVVHAENADTEIHLEITPRLDPKTALLTLAVEAGTRHGDDHRRLTTTVTVPFRDGAAGLELPGAGTSDVVRLLVIVPARR